MSLSINGPRARLCGVTGLLVALLGACATTSFEPGPPPALAAVNAFTAARKTRDNGAGARDPELWRLLRTAVREDPEWVPPRRLEDDLLVAAWRGVDALERRRQELADAPDDARAQYLVARLEGDSQAKGFERALRLDPDFAWARYAWAYTTLRAREGVVTENDPLIKAWKRAMQQARTPWEEMYFGWSLARNLEPDEGAQLLRGLWSNSSASPEDHAWLSANLARLDLTSQDFEIQRRGFERGLNVLRWDWLTRQHGLLLVEALEQAGAGQDPSGQRLELAVGAHDTSWRRAWLARRWQQRGLGDLASGLELAPADETEGTISEIEELEELFRSWMFGPALEIWLSHQPRQVLADDGLPAQPNLRRVVLAARKLGTFPYVANALEHFGQSLIEAGWYAEARFVVPPLARLDPEAARRLHRLAMAGRALLDELQEQLLIVQDPDHVPLWRADAAGFDEDESESAAELDELLQRWRRAFDERSVALRQAPISGMLGYDLEASPRLQNSFFARQLHPGPRFSEADEAAGLGKVGEVVPGLARLMDEHNRFAMVGQLFSGAPDATVLRRVFVERRSGEHLGRPWSGTVVWCDQTDVLSEAQRGGASIGGAALHEGYYVDLGSLRGTHLQWEALRREFSELEDGRQELERVLATGGLRLRTPEAQPRERKRERTSISFPLGQEQRVRLAILKSRAKGGELLGEVEFSELVERTACHEEAHLCDRRRFLPLPQKLAGVLAFALDNAFSPTAIQRRFEYRAQLVAFCVIDDPRLVLVELLSAAESDGDSGLGHGPAYRELLRDLLNELDARLGADPDAYPQLSRNHTLLHQLHRLSAEELRALALRLAEREGVVG